MSDILMRCNCNYKDSWILSDGRNVLEHYDYKAFRYVEVISPTNPLQPESFCAVVRHYPMDDNKCKFESSDPLLNNIWTICKNAVKYGSQEVFIDCPSREKGQYLGDATITSLSHLYLSGDLRLFKKELQDFAASSYICPSLMAVAPGSFMQEIADYSLQWPLQLLNYYQHSGDKEFLREMYPVAKGVVEYFKKYQRDDSLLENVKEKWNLVDWPENLRDDYDFNLSTVVGDGCHNVINLKGLAGIGEYELVYQLITSKDKHSWANMLREGATACFEVWGKDQKWNTSLCHPWASAPIPVMIEDIIGLKPAKPGWEEISFSLHIPGYLEYLTFEMQTIKGRVRVLCRRGDVQLCLL